MDSDPAPELHLRAQIAEQTTTWIHRYGGPRVLTAMREWLDYMDRQVETMQKYDGLGVADGHGHAGDKDDEEQPEFGHAPGIDKGGPSPAGALDPFGRDLAG